VRDTRHLLRSNYERGSPTKKGGVGSSTELHRTRGGKKKTSRHPISLYKGRLRDRKGGDVLARPKLGPDDAKKDADILALGRGT